MNCKRIQDEAALIDGGDGAPPNARVPLIAWLIVALLLGLVSLSPQLQFAGFRISGWAWILADIGAVATLVRNCDRTPSLPIAVWLPWIILVGIYAFKGHPGAAQNAVQVISPLLVGCASSTLRPSASEVEAFLSLMKKAAVAFVVLLLLARAPTVALGVLPDVTGFAAESISALAFQSLFLCAYLVHRRTCDLFLYLLMTAVPVLAVTRGAVAASLALALFALAPVPIMRRIWIGVMAIALAVAVFYTPRFQHKMFWSGAGSIADLYRDRQNVHFSGRDTVRELMLEGIWTAPWLGNGGNATWTMLLNAEVNLEQPHNDWLRILYNYGMLGGLLYAGAVLVQIRHGWQTARGAKPHGQVLFYGGLSAFVPFTVLMYTDNILIYGPFFGNIQFLILGMAYGSVPDPALRTPFPVGWERAVVRAGNSPTSDGRTRPA